MLAVLELGWSQYIVKVWDVIEVDNQNEEIWLVINKKALLIADEDWENTKIGTPLLDTSKVELKVLENFKWDKVRVFKMKSKKRYARTKWFRPNMTKLEVLSIA